MPFFGSSSKKEKKSHKSRDYDPPQQKQGNSSRSSSSHPWQNKPYYIARDPEKSKYNEYGAPAGSSAYDHAERQRPTIDTKERESYRRPTTDSYLSPFSPLDHSCGCKGGIATGECEGKNGDCCRVKLCRYCVKKQWNVSPVVRTPVEQTPVERTPVEMKATLSEPWSEYDYYYEE